ncbi:MAG: SDR family oxidoreductase, partial [Dehalococcoidia bacterium]|nr:SDR family oxidoreductase [Dehalococcoidia bacterium]
MSRRLENKVAVVVGAGTKGEGVGNGKATAIVFAREGAKVLCVDIDEGAAITTRDIIKGEGGQAEALRADIVSATDCQGVIEFCIAHYGRVDVLHNNVGIAGGGEILDCTEQEWERAFNVNIKGMYLMCKYTIPKMIAGGGGSIINISSIAAVRPWPSVTYTTTKGAVNALTEYIARRYGRYNIRANCIMLGYIDTPLVAPAWKDTRIREINLKQVPMQRFGSPWEGAAVAAFLASD